MNHKLMKQKLMKQKNAAYGVPHGSLRDVELKVNNVSPSSMSHSEFYQAQEDLQNFKLNEQIKF